MTYPTPIFTPEISFDLPTLTYTWATPTKKQTVDVTLTGTLPDGRVSTFLFTVKIINQCETGTTNCGSSTSFSPKDYIVTDPANSQLSFLVGPCTTTPSGCPLNYYFDVASGGSLATGVTNYPIPPTSSFFSID